MATAVAAEPEAATEMASIPAGHGSRSEDKMAPSEGGAPISSPRAEEGRRLSQMFMGAHSKTWVNTRGKGHKSAYRPGLRRPLLGKWLTTNVWNVNCIELVWFLIVAGITAGTASSGLGIAISALVSLLLIPRNSIITYFVGVAYERAVRYHVWVGVFCIVPVLIHGIGHGFPVSWSEGTNKTGSIAALLYILLLVCALPPIRRRKWELFKWLHYLFVMGFIVVAIIHKPIVGAVVAAGLVLYAIDQAIRIQRQCTPAEVVEIKRIEGSNIVGLVVNTHNAVRFAPGQYAYLSIPHVSRTEWHPFSAAGDLKGEVVTFYIRPLGGWTGKAMSVIQAGDRVRLDGPYGLPAVNWTMYAELYLFAGGIGITPLMSICRGALQASRQNELYDGVKEIHLHWTVRKPSDFLIFADQLREMRLNENPSVVSFHVNLYSSMDAPDLGIPYTRGRLNAHEVLKARAKLPPKKCCSGLRSAEDTVAVLGCGPQQLTAGLAISCADLSSEQVAFHYHAETFIF